MADHAILVHLPDDPHAPASGTATLEGAEIGLNLVPGETMSNLVLLAAAPAVLSTWAAIAAPVRAEARTRLAELGYPPSASDAELRPWCVTLEDWDDEQGASPAATWSFWVDAEEDAYIDVTTLDGLIEQWELRSIEGG